MTDWPDIKFGPINLWSMPKLEQTKESELYEKLIYENLDKFYQLKLTVSEFREKYYVNVRKYFQSYEGDFIPSKEGISMEASMHNILSLLDGLMEIVSKEESAALINKHFKDRLNEIH
jgi:Transcriptional Coactivator p15 (PC4)